MRTWARWTIAVIPVAATVIAAIASGFIVPLRYAGMVHGEFQTGTHLRRGWNEWIDHGVITSWTEDPAAGGIKTSEGRMTFGKRVGTWQQFDPMTGEVFRIEVFNDRGQITCDEWLENGVVRKRTDHDVMVAGTLTEVETLFAPDGTRLERRALIHDGVVIDDVVLQWQWRGGMRDMATSARTLPDGTHEKLTYFFDDAEDVREVVREVDGKETSRERRPRLRRLKLPDTYDYDRHASARAE